MEDMQPVFTSKATPATRGICPVCGTPLFRMGRTSAHEGMTPPKTEPVQRSGKLVIVESPAKARTVGRFLGDGYRVKASIGHVRDLLRSQISVDVENGFTPKYRVPNEKRAVVKELKSDAGKAEEIYLATDPDREGEAIAWHLMAAADIDANRTNRVVFHEITEPAIAEAFSHSREINMDLVNAQQARRILDRLVGYNLTPMLWRKVRGRLSAGRVQSVAVRLIVEREREIEAFIPEEYWSIEAEFKPKDREDTFIAKLVRVDDEDPILGNEEQVQPILHDMEKTDYIISKVKRGQRQRKPSPPFTTSTLQQEASRRLGYTARRTMRIAQQLYEGFDLGESGAVGLITYMRTDSTNVSELAQSEARQYIQDHFGEKFLPKEPTQYKTKSRGAQEAHEAIRPTSVLRTPESIKDYLSRDQYRLYQVIWRRFVASQMNPAIYDTITIEVSGKSQKHQYLLRASGSSIKFHGFLIVYEDAKDEDSQEETDLDVRVPTDLNEGMLLLLVKLLPAQHFTQPPPRYTEASLVRTLEEFGIGRPSTYAPILATILNREYIEKDGKRLLPTETGIVVNDLLVEHFPDILDVEFTASMEADLDRIASGEIDWVDVIGDFYGPFADQVEIAEENIPELRMDMQPVGRECPECGHELVVRWGRFGKFISCSNYPDCRHTEAWLEKIGVKCPLDDGDVVIRKARGRIFYGCSNYPECEFASWNRPISERCPRCGEYMVEVNDTEVKCSSCEERYLREEITENQVIESE